MTAANMFSLQFIRKLTEKSQDDRALIVCTGVDKYKITYIDATAVNKMSFDTNGSGVLRWVRRVMRLLEEDVDPFDSLQLNLPAMPSALFKIANLPNNYETILNAIEFYLDEISIPREIILSATPQLMTPQATPILRECPPAPARRHMFFDEDGNEEFRRPPIREIDFNY